ncbi:ATP-binding protein [Marinospirillum sp.]|uniref:sensor histidine kinase n=1 Tax=Marinospirillum sp. TaxID=2183934 RepID=UPI00384B5F0D
MLRFSLKLKLLVFTLAVGLVSLLLAGYLVDRHLLDYHQSSAEQLIEEGFATLGRDREGIEEALAQEAGFLRQEKRLIATLNLVNNFEDPDNYHAILFDEEKQRVTQRLLAAIQTGRSTGAYVYTLEQQLVGFATQEGDSFIQGYISYPQAQPELQWVEGSDLEGSQLEAAITRRAALHAEMPEGQRYRIEGEQVYLEQKFSFVRELGEQQKTVGYLVLVRELDVNFLAAATRGGVEAGLLNAQGELIAGQSEVREHHRQLVNILPDPESREMQLLQTREGFWGLYPLTLGDEQQAYLAFIYPMESYQKARQSTRQAILMALLLTALVIVPLSLWLVQHLVVQPLSVLMQGVEKIRQGDLISSIQLDKNDELGQFAAAMNDMASQLHQREQSLQASNQELQRLSEVMAHHFQEPTRRLRAFAERLTQQTPSGLDADAQMSVDFIREQAQRLSSLVHDVQRYLELEKVTPAPEWVATRDLLEELLDEPQLKQQLHQLNAKVILSSQLPHVYFSKRRLQEVFQALLDNALAYRNPERPLVVEIDAKKVNNCNLIYVRDNGSGIEPRYRLQVFELFTRLVPSSHTYPGTGMGLALVRRLLRQAGAEITIEEGMEGGTAFVMTFPDQE